jgi:diacylglycerol O-acyltransferase
MDRMSPLDAAFWQLESAQASLHIASVAVFAGPAPTSSEIVDLYSRKVHLVPRLRQKMRTVPFAIGRPVWVDDVEFDVTRHLHRLDLGSPASPASPEQLSQTVGQLMSAHLDADRPLWEVWVLAGLDDETWALVTKLHHSMLDGIAGMDLLSTILDDSADAMLPPIDDWTPARALPVAAIVASAVLDHARSTTGALARLGTTFRHPRRASTSAHATVRGLLGYARAARPAAATGLNGPIGAPRRYRMCSADIADVVQIKAALDGSVNDVVLAVVTRGLRDLLLSRGGEVGHDSVRCLVPVSVRTPVGHGNVGNEVSALLADLPVDIVDPLDSYRAVRAQMVLLKASHEDAAGEFLTDLAHYVLPSAAAAALHVAFRLPQRSITTVVTNVPGPSQPLYALGRRLLANFPYVPIADRVRIGIAVTSYDGRLFFGVTADRDSVPDIDVVVAGIEGALTELVKLTDLVAESTTQETL